MYHRDTCAKQYTHSPGRHAPSPDSETAAASAEGTEAEAAPAVATPDASTDADGGAASPPPSPGLATLAAIYDALDGPNWSESTDWLTEAPVDEWYGVTTDEDGRITELDLSGNGLAGELPEEVASLAALTVLNLSDNELTRGMPRELAELTNLTVLDLSGNQLMWSIPSALAGITGLRVLDLSDNRFTGGAQWLGSLPNIEEVDVSGNRLEGTIPAELGCSRAPQEGAEHGARLTELERELKRLDESQDRLVVPPDRGGVRRGDSSQAMVARLGGSPYPGSTEEERMSG